LKSRVIIFFQPVTYLALSQVPFSTGKNSDNGLITEVKDIGRAAQNVIKDEFTNILGAIVASGLVKRRSSLHSATINNHLGIYDLMTRFGFYSKKNPEQINVQGFLIKQTVRLA
jgi:hypothetical protein|tara:strand:- start:151 stop:492 length:342 start_codon:yes stop_codon:yes gene_type:complete